MESARAFALGGVFAIALGPVVLLGGCSGDSEKTGTQAKVDVKADQANQDKMREFMQNKKGAAKK